MFTLFCVCSPSVFPQKSELFSYSGRASPGDRGGPAAYSIAKGMGNIGLKSLKEGKNGSNLLFSTQSVQMQNTKRQSGLKRTV